MIETPDRLSVDKNDLDLYADIEQEVFLGKQNKDRFLFAMAFGFWHRADEQIARREGFVRAEYLTPQDEALIDALAVAEEESASILSNRRRVFDIAERYAHGGIQLLYNQVQSEQLGSFYKAFERDIFDVLRTQYHDGQPSK